VTEVGVWFESVPHAAPPQALPERLQVTPLFVGSLKNVAVMVADRPSSIVPADETTCKEIGGGGGGGAVLHPQLHTATSAARSAPTSSPRFLEVMTNLPWVGPRNRFPLLDDHDSFAKRTKLLSCRSWD
jgi:hypothetical protein